MYLWIGCVFLRERRDLLEEGRPWGWGMAVAALFAPRLARLAGLASARAGLSLPSPPQRRKGNCPPCLQVSTQTLPAPRPCRAGSQGKAALVHSSVAAAEQHERVGLAMVCPMCWLGTWALADIVQGPARTWSVFLQEFNELLH